MRKKFGCQVKFDLEGQGLSTPKTIRILSILRCISGPNLVILGWAGDEISCRQTQNEVKFKFKVKFDVEGQGRSTPNTTGTLTRVFCAFTSNLIILAWTSGELSCGQNRDWYTDTRTHGHTDAANDNGISHRKHFVCNVCHHVKFYKLKPHHKSLRFLQGKSWKVWSTPSLSKHKTRTAIRWKVNKSGQ